MSLSRVCYCADISDAVRIYPICKFLYFRYRMDKIIIFFIIRIVFSIARIRIYWMVKRFFFFINTLNYS